MTDTITLEISRQDYETVQRLSKAGLVNILTHSATGIDSKYTEWTWEDLEKHMVAVQRLKRTTKRGRRSTIADRFTKLRYLQDHPEAPVELRPPNEATWIDHIHHRSTMEPEFDDARLKHYRLALISLLKFLGLPQWPSLYVRYQDKRPHRLIPPDDLVPRFWTELHHPCVHTRRTMMYVMHFAFGAGIRAPGEHLDMSVDDIEWDSRTVIVTQEKKGGEKRAMHLPAYMVTGRNDKSLWNYVHTVRPRVDRGESGALWLDSLGREWSYGVFQQTLSSIGKQVWSGFYPYCTRHWFATTFLRDNEFNIYKTADALGDTVRVAETYVDQARVRESMARRGVRGFVRRRRRVATE